ncbi:hypothetical protein [Phenylobacterium sp. SCN 70-31]|uniref:hypothetical protein n=1 Tax=Phenylobacterium sp. SCN 70-31 TaxID=1660129 RepID=UPI00086B376D|nr:hypothetical protein [Phenylobacterium sp. SCN 70-31]ODT88812.1 MAG: hypothetical protein ABS78_06555 [Phenylobacterium sp. SCN 70-31]
MADGEITLKLDDDMQRRLTEAADAARMSVEDYVRGIIREDLGHDAASDILAESRRRLATYDRTGAYISVEEAMAHFNSELEARLAGRD